jgi:hypothetical protein
MFKLFCGASLGGSPPSSFGDVNALRTDLRHDLDHGKPGKVRSKRRKSGAIFFKYAGQGGTAETLEPSRFVFVQANLLAAVETDLRGIVHSVALVAPPKF